MPKTPARTGLFALAVCAGSLAALPPGALGAPGDPHAVTVAAARGQSEVRLDGRTVRTTGAAVAHQRAVSFAGSRTVVALWDEVGAAGSTPWFALSLDGGASTTQVMPAGQIVRLKHIQFDPVAAAAPAVHRELAADAAASLYLVHFAATPLEEMRVEVRALGGEVLRFLTDDTHIVRLPASALPAVQALPYVRWVGAYHPAYRLEASIGAAVASGAKMAPARYSIECMHAGRADQQALGDYIAKLGGTVHSITPDQYRMEATLTRAQLLAVARRDEVSYIDRWGGPLQVDFMDIARQITGATASPSFQGLASLGYTGQGVRGEVIDTEVRLTHQAFQNRPLPLLHRGSAGHPNPPSIPYHGTSCYAIDFGVWAQQPTTTGMLPDAEQGIFCDATLATQFGGTVSRLTLNQELVDPAGPYRAVFQTSSVGSALTTDYTTISAEVDDYLLRTDLLSTQSQGNSSSQNGRPQAWAKNIVSVGGVQFQSTLDRADDTNSSASYGPASDGRVKPDLSHFFDGVVTATAFFTDANNQPVPCDTCSTVFVGTSGSTPITAGAFGLFFQLWHAGAIPGRGGGPSVFADRPHMTTAKAMLINTAYRYGPSNPSLTRARQGWGMADLGNLYTLRSKMFIVDQGDPLTNGATRVYHISVAPGEPTLSATMTFPDPMGATAGGQARVNDLSLRVTSPDGQFYWGNNGLDLSNFSTPGGSANTVDTVENVFVQSPASGIWTVEVLATQVVQDAYLGDPAVNAPFSLVVSGGLFTTSSPPCYANCDASTTLPFLNVQDFSCFLARFAAGDPYANCDHSTVPPALNVQDFTCFLAKFAAGCSAP